MINDSFHGGNRLIKKKSLQNELLYFGCQVMNDSYSKIKGRTLPSSPPSQNTPNILKKKKSPVERAKTFLKSKRNGMMYNLELQYSK